MFFLNFSSHLLLKYAWKISHVFEIAENVTFSHMEIIDQNAKVVWRQIFWITSSALFAIVLSHHQNICCGCFVNGSNFSGLFGKRNVAAFLWCSHPWMSQLGPKIDDTQRHVIIQTLVHYMLWTHQILLCAPIFFRHLLLNILSIFNDSIFDILSQSLLWF